MNISIPCSHCGPRPIQEFIYGEIPNVPDEIADPDARDFDRAFMRANPEGVQYEAWFHAYGCRRWIRLYRDTRTDEIDGGD